MSEQVKVIVNAATGKMGQQVIFELANHAEAKLVAAICRPAHPSFGKSVYSDSTLTYSADLRSSLAIADVIIDFSLPEVTLDLLSKNTSEKKAVLIGTTGFNQKQLESIDKYAQSFPVLLAPNTSIGVNSTLLLIQQAAKLLGQRADIEIFEAHHRHKVDAPSGTAIKMGETIAKAMDKNFSDIKVCENRFQKRARQKGEIGMSVMRAGEIVGDHKVVFALDNELVSIAHSAQNRRCFAEGAIEAAVWVNRQTSGLYSMADFMAERSA